MLQLSRTIRFCVSGGLSSKANPPRHNAYSSWPAMRGLGRYYQLQVTCHGLTDPVTGYFINIKDIDRAVHDHAVPRFEQALSGSTASEIVPLGQLLQDVTTLLQPALRQSVQYVRLHLTPMYSLQIRNHDMKHLVMRQQYEFSAAHRLHVAKLSNEDNHQLFGKCNNPAGHGHNYRVEVAVRVAVDDTGHVPMVEHLDAIVAEAVIAKLDHKYLNVDVSQFKQLNPSVENITQVIYEMLEPALTALDDGVGVKLESVSVWETEKTVCTYSGPTVTETQSAARSSRPMQGPDL